MLQQKCGNKEKKKTRKEFREGKAKKNQKGLIILQVVYYSGRMLIAFIFELLRFFKS